MTDAPQGDGWWQASDGLWYAPETHPDYMPPAPPPGAVYRTEPSPVAPPAPPAPPPAPPSMPAPPPSHPVESESRSPWFWVGISFVGFAVLALGALLVIGLLIDDDGRVAVSVEEVRVNNTGTLAPQGAFVTTGVESATGLVLFGTTDDDIATSTEVWNADVLTEGPGPAVVVGQVEVPVGVPYLYGVAAQDGGFLAAGEVYFPESGDSQTAMFSSVDGIDWSLVAPPDSVGTASAVFDVAVVGDVSIAVATDDDLGINRLHRSDDGGVTWRLAREIGIENATVWGLGAGDDRFYAVGESINAEGLARPTLHASDDGALWTELRFVFDGSFVAGRLFDVAAVDGGFLAVGSQPQQSGSDVLVMFSDDGDVWERVPVPLAVQSDEVLFSVIRTANGAVATGQIDDRYTFWEITIDQEK